jgi:hypothetical protein
VLEAFLATAASEKTGQELHSNIYSYAEGESILWGNMGACHDSRSFLLVPSCGYRHSALR